MQPTNGFVFSGYLESLLDTFKDWWDLYAITDTKTLSSSNKGSIGSPFEFGLMVQTLDPSSSDQSNYTNHDIERLTVLEGLEKYATEHVLLQGKPGSGKTTALKRLLLEKAEIALSTLKTPPQTLLEESKDSDLQGAGGETQPIIPVLIELRYYQTSVFDLIRDFFKRHSLLLDPAQIEQLLFEQKVLLLIDGLNELPSDSAWNDLCKFCQDYSQTSLVVTTREIGSRGDLPDIAAKLSMLPLSKSQMEKFVRTYLPEQGEQLIKQLDSRLQDFGQTPLLLWMLCELFRQTETIPSNLGLIFRHFTQIYENNLKQDVHTESDRRLWSSTLQYLAFIMMLGSDPIDKPTEFYITIPRTKAQSVLTEFFKGKTPYPEQSALYHLDDLLKYHLLQKNGDRIEFKHQLLQEYYAAEYLFHQLYYLSKEHLQSHYLNYLKWTEPIILMMSLLETHEQSIRLVKLASDVDLALSARLTGASLKQVQPRILEWMVNRELSACLTIYLLGLTHSELAIQYLRPWFQSDDFYVRDAIVAALYEIQSEATIPILEHFLDDLNGDIAGRAATILGEIARELDSMVAISALGAAITHQSVYVRNNIIDALGSSYSKTAIPFLEVAYSDPEWENRRRVMDAMAQIPSEEVIPTIVQAFQDHHVKVRYAAMEALRYISGTNTGYKVAIAHSNNVLLHNSDPVMRSIAVQVLKHSGDKSVLPLLEASLTTEDDPLIRSAIKTAIDGFEELPAYVRSLPPWDRIRWRIRRTTSKHNGKTYQKPLSLDSQIDADILIQELQTKGHAARSEAIRQLKECNNSEFMYSTAMEIIRNHLFRVEDSEEIYNIVGELQSIQKQCNFYHNNFYQLAKEFSLEIFPDHQEINTITINVENAYGVAGHVGGNQVVHSSLGKNTEDTV